MDEEQYIWIGVFAFPIAIIALLFVLTSSGVVYNFNQTQFINNSENITLNETYLYDVINNNGLNYTINVNNTEHLQGRDTPTLYNYFKGLLDAVYVPYTGATSNVDLNGKNLVNVSYLGVGTDANKTDFPKASAIFSAGNSGHTYAERVGIVGESIGEVGTQGIGVGGVAKTQGNFPGIGVFGRGIATNANAGDSVGVQGSAISTHTGGANIAFKADAQNGALNYSFYGLHGKILNTDNIETLASVVEGVPTLLKLNQTTPQTFTNFGGGTGIMKVTAGLLGLDTSNYVPYTGATSNVDLGAKNLTTTNGKVGIGTNSPTTDLTIQEKGSGSNPGSDGITIYGSQNASQGNMSSKYFRLFIDGWGATNFLSNDAFVARATYNWFNPSTTNGFNLFSIGTSGYTEFRNGSGGAAMRITSAGNVGIGTTTPLSGLHIVKNSIIEQLRLSTNENDLTSKFGGLVISHYTNTEEPFVTLYGSSTSTDNTVNFGGGSSTANSASIIKFYTASNSSTLTGTERMRIQPSGRVGIGTTAPSSRVNIYRDNTTSDGNLELTGDKIYPSFVSSSASDTAFHGTFFNMYRARGTQSSKTSVVAGDTLFSYDNWAYNGSTNLRALQLKGMVEQVNATNNDVGGYWAFATSNAKTGENDIERMRINQEGNVGIGTSSPLEKLHIIGNILLNDTYKMLFGDGKDASIYYDGTNLNINPKEVGTGQLKVLGNLNATGYNVTATDFYSGTSKGLTINKQMLNASSVSCWMNYTGGLLTATNC